MAERPSDDDVNLQQNRHHRLKTGAAGVGGFWFYMASSSDTMFSLIAAQRKQAQSGASTPATRPGTPTGGAAPKKKVPGVSAAAATVNSATKNASAAPAEGKQLSQVQQDLKNMGLDDEEAYVKEDVSTLPTVSVAKEKILADLREREKQEGYKPVLSMVVVGMWFYASPT